MAACAAGTGGGLYLSAQAILVKAARIFSKVLQLSVWVQEAALTNFSPESVKDSDAYPATRHGLFS